MIRAKLAVLRELISELKGDGTSTGSLLAMVTSSFALLILAGALAFHLARRSAEAEDWITHTMNARREARSLLVELLNAETSERGFVITRDETFLEPFDQSDVRVNTAFAELIKLTDDNPSQQGRLLLLKPKIEIRMEELRSNIALVRDGRSEAAVSVIRQKVGKKLMDDIRGDLDRVFAEEARLLAIRTTDALFQRRLLLVVITACLLIAIVLAVATLAVMLRSISQLREEMQQRQRTEEHLRQSQKLESVGQLTGGIAHDFNNLLTIILGNLDTVRRRMASTPESPASNFSRFVENGLEATRSAAKLTHKLLAFSRRQPLDPKRIDINRVVAEMSDLLKRTFGETIEIESVLAAGLWPNHADPHQLENAILNLANNARDAMPDGGRITIETANTFLDEAYVERFGDVAAGQYTMLSVADTGHGIPPEAMQHMFEPFFTTKEVGKGTGLGLAMIHGFVKQSGGHIRIYSEVGHGTTVKIYLPRWREGTEAKEPIARELPAPADSRARPGETILLVEDSEGVRVFAHSALEELGYQVISASNGAEALQALEADPRVDLLLTDVVLPGGMSGRVLADTIRRKRPSLPVIYMTGYTRNAIIHHGRLDPDVELLSKPFTQMDLALRVRKML